MLLQRGERAQTKFDFLLGMVDDSDAESSGQEGHEIAGASASVAERLACWAEAIAKECSCLEKNLLRKTIDAVYEFHLKKSAPETLPSKRDFAALVKKNILGTEEKDASIVLYSQEPDTGKTTLVTWTNYVFPAGRTLAAPDSMYIIFRLNTTTSPLPSRHIQNQTY